MTPGKLIVIEGIDGTGKSTQAAMLHGWLNHMGQETVLSREPTAGPWGQRVRESATLGRLSPEEETNHFMMDRREHVENLILPNIRAGRNVVLDRYYFSTMAYQSQRGLDPLKIRKDNEQFAPVPDILLILDLDTDTALQRIGIRGDEANEFEKKDSLQKCREIYLEAGKESFAIVIPCHPTQAEVGLRIREEIAPKLRLPHY